MTGAGTTSGPHPTAGPTDPPQPTNPTDPTNPTNPTNPPEPQGGSISNPQTGLCLAVDSQVYNYFQTLKLLFPTLDTFCPIMFRLRLRMTTAT